MVYDSTINLEEALYWLVLVGLVIMVINRSRLIAQRDYQKLRDQRRDYQDRDPEDQGNGNTGLRVVY